MIAGYSIFLSTVLFSDDLKTALFTIGALALIAGEIILLIVFVRKHRK